MENMNSMNSMNRMMTEMNINNNNIKIKTNNNNNNHNNKKTGTKKSSIRRVRNARPVSGKSKTKTKTRDKRVIEDLLKNLTVVDKKQGQTNNESRESTPLKITNSFFPRNYLIPTSEELQKMKEERLAKTSNHNHELLKPAEIYRSFVPLRSSLAHKKNKK